jgi:hypothetical protein
MNKNIILWGMRRYIGIQVYHMEDICKPIVSADCMSVSAYFLHMCIHIVLQW